jgi:hypothetical protein
VSFRASGFVGRSNGIGRIDDWRVANDQPVPHRDHSLGVSRNVRFVGDYDDRETFFSIEPLEDRYDFDARPRIQVSRRFIRKQDRGVLYEGSSDPDALLLPTG